MDGTHDLGGRQGFGPIPRSDSEASFETDWHRRVFGLGLLSGLANADAFRHAIERIPPADYLAVGYWGRWLAAIELLASEDDPKVRPAGNRGAKRSLDRAPAFAVGDRVRTRDLHTKGHTRLPAYARRREGVVAHAHGAWVFPDSNARGAGEDPQYAYAVRFEGAELWGDGAEPGICVHIDLFEPYLESPRG